MPSAACRLFAVLRALFLAVLALLGSALVGLFGVIGGRGGVFASRQLGDHGIGIGKMLDAAVVERLHFLDLLGEGGRIDVRLNLLDLVLRLGLAGGLGLGFSLGLGLFGGLVLQRGIGLDVARQRGGRSAAPALYSSCTWASGSGAERAAIFSSFFAASVAARRMPAISPAETASVNDASASAASVPMLFTLAIYSRLS